MPPKKYNFSKDNSVQKLEIINENNFMENE